MNSYNNKNFNEVLNDSGLSGITTANVTHTDNRSKINESNKNNKITNDNTIKQPLKNSAVMKLNFDNI